MVHGIKFKNNRIDIVKVIDNKSIWQPIQDIDITKVEDILTDLKQKCIKMSDSIENLSMPVKFDEFERPIADLRILKNINTETYNAISLNPFEKVEEGENNLFRVSNQSMLFEKMKQNRIKQNKNVREKKKEKFNIEEAIHSTYFHCTKRKNVKYVYYMYKISLKRKRSSKEQVLKSVFIDVTKYKDKIDLYRDTSAEKVLETIEKDKKGRFKAKKAIIKDIVKSKIMQKDEKDIDDDKSNDLHEYLLNDEENKLIHVKDIKMIDLPSWMKESK